MYREVAFAPYKMMANRMFSSRGIIIIDVGDIKVGGQEPIVIIIIGGPCVLCGEAEKMMEEIASRYQNCAGGSMSPRRRLTSARTSPL